MFKIAIILCAVFVGSKAFAIVPSILETGEWTEKIETSDENSSIVEPVTSGNDAAMEITTTEPNYRAWKLPMEIHKIESEKTINDTVNIWEKYMNSRRVYNEKIVMERKEKFNGSMRNTVTLLTQLIKSAVEKRNNISNAVDASDCGRYSEFSEAADAARIKAEKCIDDEVRTSLGGQTNIDYIVLKELDRLKLVRKQFRRCDDDVDDESSAVEAMHCYEIQKNEASRGVSEGMNEITAEIEKNIRSSDSLEAAVNSCRDNNGFTLLFNMVGDIVKELDECIQRKIDEATGAIDEGDSYTVE